MPERFCDAINNSNSIIKKLHTCPMGIIAASSFTKPTGPSSTLDNDGYDYGLGGLQDPRCVSGPTLLPPSTAPRRKLDAWPTNKREIASFWYLASATPTPSSLPPSLPRLDQQEHSQT